MLGLITLSLLSACSKQENNAVKNDPAAATTAEVAKTEVAANIDNNPLLQDWQTPYQIPPFSKIKDEHYMPAVEKAVQTMREEIAAITSNENDPSFENTVVALEQSGEEITKVFNVFANVAATDTNDELKKLQVKIFPMLTRELDAMLLNQELFDRVSHVYENRDPLKLDAQDSRLLELTYLEFVRAGAALKPEAKARLKDINAEISSLTTQFAQNLLSETKSFELVIDDAKDLAGLPKDLVGAAKKKAENKGKDNAWVFGLDRASFEGFMTYSENRELRKIMLDGYRNRGMNANEADNSELVLKISRLRAERAKLLGYDSHAHYQLETRMAKTPEMAESFLLKVLKPGLARVQEEKQEMQAIVKSEGHDFQLASHDWWHYAEKLRTKKYTFDESQVKPYFELENVLQGAFHVAGELFGVKFKELKDMPVWHPQVKVFDVSGEKGEHLGIFLMDFYSRDSKRGGAWMSSYRQASAVNGKVIRPLITNNLNLTPPAEGDPTLLSFDQVNTLFHEFGHGLHGLMTTARYEKYAGTSGSPRDFTEFPAQFMEHYASAPEVLPIYAKHYETGEIIPAALLEKLQQASTHNQGFKTAEFIGASLLDLAWHKLDSKQLKDIDNAQEFEAKVLTEYGLPKEISPRYRSTYFAHIFSSPIGYSAGYYAYLWSEILDADGFTAFREAGDIYDKELAQRLADNVYRAGGSAPADELYRRFRKKDPTIEPLLKIRGLN